MYGVSVDFVLVVSMLHVCSSEIWYCGEWGVVFIRCVLYGRGESMWFISSVPGVCVVCVFM